MNPRGVAKYSDFGPIDGYISETVQDMVNFGPLAADIVSLVWGTPGNFNGFRVLASLLHRRRPTEINQILHDVWPSPGIHFGGLLPPNGILPGAKFTLRPSLTFSYIGIVTARHSSSGHQLNFVPWDKEENYRTFATYIPQGGHHVGYRPTF